MEQTVTAAYISYGEMVRLVPMYTGFIPLASLHDIILVNTVQDICHVLMVVLMNVHL